LVLALAATLAACSPSPKFHSTDITGAGYGRALELTGHDGRPRTLQDFRGKRNVLLVFHPFAFTPVCSEEALDLQANLASFENAETEVIFVSCDTSAARQAWKQELGATYAFASDFWQHGAAARAYGVFNDATGAPRRGTFLIDKEGIVIWSLVKDDKREERQVGIVDVDGGSASHTGHACLDWAGSITGDGYAIQGNILTGEDVVLAMQTAWETSDPSAPLARRLLETLTAGDQAGGDSRGRQSAALLVVKEGAGYGGLDDVAVDLRVDDHETPIPELARLLDLSELYLQASTEDEKVPVTKELEEELQSFAHTQDAHDFQAWVGTENYEMRVAPDLSWIDQKILDIVRSTPAKDA
jgi:uncharacterized Ntn-hydrolase superfamily protein